MYLNDLNKYLDKVKSRLKNLDFKNLDRDKKKVDLDMKDNLDGFQKLVSTQWTFSISISIGLDRRDPQPYLKSFYSGTVCAMRFVILKDFFCLFFLKFIN